jgi:synaptotagmin-like protein
MAIVHLDLIPGDKGQLHVLIKEARNLTAVRSNGFSDPFCKG